MASPKPPIPAELFSVARLEEHARRLAEAQRVVPGDGRPLDPRLNEDTQVPIETFRTIAAAACVLRLDGGQRIAGAMADDGATHRVQVILG